MKLKTAIASVALAGSIAAVSAPAMARDTVNVVGSSTVYPFATVVAERFGRNTNFPTPKLESTGSGGGLKLFCAGIGTQHPDITNASRRMKKSEFELCQSNGVKEITEVKIGADGIVIANSKDAEKLDLSLKQVFLALAKEVPDPKGGDKLVANPFQKWSDIDSSLPNLEISVMGPPPTSGTRDAFVEIAMEGGCKTFDFIKAMEKKDMKSVCHSMREDGPFVEAGENDNLIVQRLNADENAMGIFGYSFLFENLDALKGVEIAGVAPSTDTIADKSYPISRPLYVYFKNAHRGVIPNLEEFVEEYMSDDALEEDGYLAERGLVALPEDARYDLQDSVLDAVPMDMK